MTRPGLLLIGGAGYVGSHVARDLLEAGRRVVVLDDLSTGHRELVPAGATLHVGRLEDRALLQSVLERHEIGTVLHFAAKSIVEDSVANPRAYFEANCGGALGLLATMLEGGVRSIVFSSTASVFGAPQVQPIDEEHPRQPTNPYGVTKLFVEYLLRAYESHGLRSVSLRYFNAAGAHPSGELGEWHDHETHLIPRVLDVVMGRSPAVQLFGADYPTRDGTALRDYVHVCDLSRAHVAAVAHLEQGGSSLALNLGSGRGATVGEIIAAVRTVTGREVSVVHAPRRAGDPSSLIACSRRAEELFGWRAERSGIETIIDDAWRWHRRLRGGDSS